MDPHRIRASELGVGEQLDPDVVSAVRGNLQHRAGDLGPAFHDQRVGDPSQTTTEIAADLSLDKQTRQRRSRGHGGAGGGGQRAAHALADRDDEGRFGARACDLVLVEQRQRERGSRPSADAVDPLRRAAPRRGSDRLGLPRRKPSQVDADDAGANARTGVRVLHAKRC
jgi:hypothetical protein